MPVDPDTGTGFIHLTEDLVQPLFIISMIQDIFQSQKVFCANMGIRQDGPLGPRKTTVSSITFLRRYHGIERRGTNGH